MEKILKAWLADQGDVTPRTHKIVDLVVLIGDARLAGLADAVRELDRFYIPNALPGALPEGLPGESEANEAFDVARQVMALAEA